MMLFEDMFCFFPPELKRFYERLGLGGKQAVLLDSSGPLVAEFNLTSIDVQSIASMLTEVVPERGLTQLNSTVGSSCIMDNGPLVQSFGNHEFELFELFDQTNSFVNPDEIDDGEVFGLFS